MKITDIDWTAKLGLASGSMSFLSSFLVADVFGYLSHFVGLIPLGLGGLGAFYAFLVKKQENEKIKHETRTAEIEKLIAEAKLKEMQQDDDKDKSK